MTGPKFNSFAEKLQLYMSVFQQKYDLAKQKFPTARIILVSHEYAITKANDTNSQVIDYEEHLLLQALLKSFTLLNPNSTFIFPYAFSKEYHGADVLPKMNKIAQRFQDDSYINKRYTVEEEHLITYQNRSKKIDLKKKSPRCEMFVI